MINLLLKRAFLPCVLLLLAQAGLSQGYAIHLVLKPFAHSLVYLGYHYGKIKAVADSTVLDENAAGDFKGKDKLPEGVYFIVSPKKVILFELLIGRQQQFSVSADTARIPESIDFSGSPENSAFQEYTAFMNSRGREITAGSPGSRKQNPKRIPLPFSKKSGTQVRK